MHRFASSNFVARYEGHHEIWSKINVIDIEVDDFNQCSIRSAQATVRLTRRKSQGLVAVLARNSGHNETRQRLCSLLWSNSSESNARTSLRQEIANLRTKMTIGEHSLLQADKMSVALTNCQAISRSQKTILTLAEGEISEILLETPLLQERLLSHLQGVDPELDLWIEVERASFERRCSELLQNILYQPETDIRQKKRAARALLNIDPSHETAIISLIQALQAEGAEPAARMEYEKYCTILRQEYDLTPSGRVIKALETNKPSTSSAPSSPTIQPVRPAPARNPHHADRGPLIIATSLTETTKGSETAMRAMRTNLIGALARFRDWTIRETTGNPNNLDLPDQWFELRFAGIQDKDEPGLTTNLVAMPDVEILWSDSLMFDQSGDAAIQKSTIRRIAACLNLEISARRVQNALTATDGERNPHDSWLLAHQRLLTWRASDESEAESAFRKILARWPTHAPSLSSLVEVLNTRHHIFPGVMPNLKRSQEALELAKRAARIAPQDNRIQLALGWSHLMVKRPEPAHHYFKMALRLNDNDPLTLISSAMGLCYSGDHELAAKVANQSLETGAGGEPIHWAYHACIRFYCDDLQGANDAAQMASGSAHFLLGMQAAIAGLQGDKVRASDFAHQFCEEISQNWYSSKIATPATIREWLVASFPIGSKPDRDKLERGLNAAKLR